MGASKGHPDGSRPFDGAVFGTMKAMCRRRFWKHNADDPMRIVNRQIVAQFLMRSWEQVGPSVITPAWSLYLNPTEEEEK
jgi:hypothetical protein